MKYIRGGLKLKDETKKGFTPVYDMLNRENSLLYDLNMVLNIIVKIITQ